MKSSTKFIALATLLIITFTSCSIEKRTYRSGYHVTWHKKKVENEKISGTNIKNDASTGNKVDEVLPLPLEEKVQVVNSDIPLAATNTSVPAAVNVKQNKLSRFFQDCDNIILRNGDEISAKVLEVTIDVIKYRKCDNPDGPIYSILKSDVFMIKYANGTKDIISKENETGKRFSQTLSDSPPKDETMGIIGMILGIIAWFIPVFALAIAMLVMAFTLGIASLSKIQKNPGKYKGKGFAITAIALGVVGIILILALDLGSDFK